MDALVRGAARVLPRAGRRAERAAETESANMVVSSRTRICNSDDVCNLKLAS
jgi:hypothetical protein